MRGGDYGLRLWLAKELLERRYYRGGTLRSCCAVAVGLGVGMLAVRFSAPAEKGGIGVEWHRLGNDIKGSKLLVCKYIEVETENLYPRKSQVIWCLHLLVVIFRLASSTRNKSSLYFLQQWLDRIFNFSMF